MHASRRRLPTHLKAVLCGLFLVAAGVLPGVAAEVIRSYIADVTAEIDGSVDVTETITVNVQGNQIRRGIFRDIPTILVDDEGGRLHAGFEVLDVQRDGHDESYSVEGIEGGKRIRIGDPQILLPYGEHTYSIRYTMSRMARYFDDHDEIYWNATGNYWAFPIEQAIAHVTLPEGAEITDLVGYTGYQGSTEQAVAIERTADNSATFRATRALGVQEGLTIAVALKKGVLAEPDQTQQVLNWLSDHREMVMPGLAAVLVLLYYYFAWNAVGRDPRKGTIIPMFHAPKGFSPALVHYIHRMGWQKSGWTAFTAAIFSLGTKGLLTVHNPGGDLTINATGKRPEDKLPPGEQVLFDYFRIKGKVKVSTSNGPDLNKKRGEFVNVLESENRQVYFNNNTGYVVVGVLLSAAALLVMVLSDVIAPVYLLLALIGGVGLGLFSSLLSAFWSAQGFRKLLTLFFAALVIGNFGVAGLSLFDGLKLDAGLIGAGSIVLINVVFAILMRAPTVQGRRIMDQIEGFRMYLETAEKNRLNMAGEPPMTVERFERILPYAIALGVEEPWSEHFEGELSRNAVADADRTYSPGFYTGRNWSSGGFSKSVSSVAAGMSAAMIAAQPSSSSSSGFSGGGGGGFSGGGGGGGGGGGW